jgi:tRNA A-37 threonylcarbamoyl transferase component Bud32
VVGTLIGQYRIASLIGAGGMGTVYLGQHTLIGRRAAIKVLRPELCERRDAVERFFNEARAAAAINNPGIVQIFDFGFADDGGAYIVMELLEGMTLAARLLRDGQLATLDALRLIRQVASSMAAAHAVRIIHRDLKPDNIFLVHDAEVTGGSRTKVLDFGVAKLERALFDVSRTRAGAIIGTPLYMAPEQCQGLRTDERTDVYALGCVLFEALAGSPPFQSSAFAEVIRSHVDVPPPAPSSRHASVSSYLDALVLQCLEKDPADRFQSMTELADAIEAALDGDAAPPPALVVTRGHAGLGSWSPPPQASGRADGPAQAQPGGSPRPAPAQPGPSPGPVMYAHGDAGDWIPHVPLPGPATAQSGGSLGREIHARDLSSRGAPGGYEDEPSRDHFAELFAAALPPALQDLLPYAVDFLRELFRTAERIDDRLIRLGAPVIRDLESRAHFVLFVDDIEADATAPFGQAGTRAFRAQVDPFTSQLVELDAPPGSVLITVLAAPQLGQGARETIFALRKERNLFVVPIAAAEIRRACDAGTARGLLINRIADLHTVSDPFAIFEGSTDPTRWVGFSAEVADLVKYIVAGGKIVSVAGPPGSGKTSMIAMAEYGCDTSKVARRFVRIPCSDLSSHDPRRLLEEITARVRRMQRDRPGSQDHREPPGVLAEATPPDADLRATILELGAPDLDPGTDPDRRAAHHETGLAIRHQLVLVLEDADWLIRLASSSEPDLPQRQSARELWSGLAQLCASGKHTVIVTSIRDFQVMEQVPLERPVSVSRVPLRALSRRESDNLVTSLGELVGFRPTPRAFAALHRESGGNVYALRILCSDIIRSTRERADYSPLASLEVTPRLVETAADRIAATGSSFRTHVSLWLDDAETLVLQHIAKDHPRSPRKIRGALDGSATPAQVAKALDGLELMGLVEHRGGRHRVRIPLFERWINNHLDAPRAQRTAIEARRVSRVALGFTCTALLFGGYWTWLRSTRSTRVATVAACTYELDYPDRIGLDEPIEIFVYQDCTRAAVHALSVEPVFSSLGGLQITSDCTATSTSCTTTVKTTAGKQAHDLYQVRLRVDGELVTTAAIEKDRFAAARAIGERSVPAISFIPLLLSLVLSFHKEMKKYIAQLFGRGQPRPSSQPDADPAPEPKSS